MSNSPKVFPVITPLHRKAIWEAHGRRCAYENSLLEWDALHIDHILPQALWRNTPERERIFSILGLSPSFEANDVTNLVPCRNIRNGQKSDWVFEEKSARFFRQLAEENTPAVHSWLAKLREQEEQDRIRSNAEAACAANPALRAKLLEALASTVPFSDEDYYDNDSFRFSRSRVRLRCHQPRVGRDGSLLIEFNSLYLHAVSFTFETPAILSKLLCGWNTESTFSQRGFVLGHAENRQEEWIVNLGGTAVFLTAEELGQLCTGVDRLAPHFLEALGQRERQDGTLAFSADGARNVRLLTIKRALWREILAFARKHDYDKGNSPWHIFDASGSGHIKIVHRTADGQVIPFNAYIYAASPNTASYGPMIEPEDDVCLCWDASQSRLHPQPDGTAVIGWSAATTFQWLKDKLIPEVVRRVAKPSLVDRFRQYSGLKEPPRYFCETYGVSASLLKQPSAWSELAKFTDDAQELYIEHSNEPAPRTVVESTLAGLVLLADALPVPEDKLGYIAIKLGVPCEGNLRQLVAVGRSQFLGQASFTSSDVEYILRCAIAVFHSSTPPDGSHPDLLHTVTAAWHPLMTAAQYEAIRHRTLERLQNPGSR